MNVLVCDVGGNNIKVLATGQDKPRKIPSGPAMTAQSMASEVKELAGEWKYDVVSIGYPGPIRQGQPAAEPHNLGRGWEPDFVILNRVAPHQVRGGCVCFPSGWSLREKIGKSLFLTHAPVPGLNNDLGANISKLLSRIEVDQFFQRTNWGLTGAAELDQHPRHKIPAIAPEADPQGVHLRIEWQVLTAISVAALLFGIRVFHVPIEEVKSSPELASRLARNLETMPDAVAQYKRLDQCRGWLVKYLRD